MELAQLPNDIINSLFLLLDIKSIVRLGRSCKYWQNIVCVEDFWKRICLSADKQAQLPPFITRWKDLYVMYLSWDWSDKDQISVHLQTQNNYRELLRETSDGTNPSARTVELLSNKSKVCRALPLLLKEGTLK